MLFICHIIYTHFLQLSILQVFFFANNFIWAMAIVMAFFEGWSFLWTDESCVFSRCWRLTNVNGTVRQEVAAKGKGLFLLMHTVSKRFYNNNNVAEFRMSNLVILVFHIRI